MSEIESFIHFAIRARDAMCDCISQHPASSAERYKLYQQICPRYVEDVTQTRLAKALAEAKRLGMLATLGTRLEVLDAGLKEYAQAFIEHPQGNLMLPEPSGLNNGLNALLPYVTCLREQGAPKQTERQAVHDDIRVSLLRVLKTYSDPTESIEKWPPGLARQGAVRARRLWPKGGGVPESYLPGLVRDDLRERGLAPIDDRYDVFALVVNDVLGQLEGEGRVERLGGEDAEYQTLNGRTAKAETAWRLRETAGGKRRGRPRSQPQDVNADRQIHDAWVQYRNSNPGATFEQFAESRGKGEDPSELKAAHERYRKRISRLR